MFFILLLSLPRGAFGKERPNGLGKLPAMGWNTWNSLKCDYDERVILDVAKRMKSLGLRVSLNKRYATNRSWVNKQSVVGSNSIVD
jgi:alpha-galactosidase